MPDENVELARISRQLVFRVAVTCFDGEFPEDLNIFRLLEALTLIMPAEMSDEQKQEVTPYLYAAVCEYRASQNRLPS